MKPQYYKANYSTPRVQTEIAAGITSFMTMAYILVVNPQILSSAGIPKGGVFIATALSAFVGSVLMAALSNYPFVLAPGMGLNAFFAYTVCLKMGYSWQFALLAVFVEGLIFLALSLTPVRERMFNAIPFSLKKAVSVGLGLFIAFIGLQNAKVVVDNPATLLSMTSFHEQIAAGTFRSTGICAVLALLGVIITAVLIIRRFKAGILLGILCTWILGIICEVCGLYRPDGATTFSVIPHFSTYFKDLGGVFSEFTNTFAALFDPTSWTVAGKSASGWALVNSLDFFVVMFAFFFVDLFDTLGTLIGVSIKGGFLDKNGKLPRISGALCADSIATFVGAIFGTSTTTTYVESASGVAAGGRTGLTAVVAAFLFLLSILLAPIFRAIPSFATAPALIIVGFYMISSIVKIDFEDYSEAIPAFICLLTMPLAYSISDGIMFGIISYTFINLFAGKFRKLSPIIVVLTIIFIAKYALM